MHNQTKNWNQEFPDHNQKSQQSGKEDHFDPAIRIMMELTEKEARYRKEIDRAFLEDGVISLRHFSEAKHRLFDYALQQSKTFRVEDLRHLILVRDRINTFIERVEWANEGHEEVERLLQLYENEGENWRLNRPDW